MPKPPQKIYRYDAATQRILVQRLVGNATDFDPLIVGESGNICPLYNGASESGPPSKGQRWATVADVRAACERGKVDPPTIEGAP